MSSVLIGALFLAIWNSILFYGKDLGISVVLFMVPLLGFVIYELKVHDRIKNRFGLLFVAPILLLSLTYFIFDNQVFRIFNVVVITLLFILMYLYTIKPTFNLWEMFGDVFAIVFEPIDHVVQVLQDVEEKMLKAFKVSDEVKKYLKSLIIVVPIVLVILFLLASADMVFENIFSSFFHYFDDLEWKDFFGNLVGRLCFIAILFVYLSALIYFLVRKFSNTKYEFESLGIKVSGYTIRLLLTVLNVIYILFDIIQIRSLMLHQVTMDISYAEYARQGFFQLMFVSVINLGIILFSKAYEDKESKHGYEKFMCTMMIGLTFIIIVSSFLRMNMYESEYGCTMLRLLVYVALFTESVMLIPTVVYVFNSKFNIIKYYMVIGIGVYVLLNYSNVDMLIAKRNIDRYYQEDKIDLVYLKNEGADNIELLIDLYQNTEDADIHNALADYFYKVEFKMDGFQEYNLARKKANQLLWDLKIEYVDVPKDILFSGE